MRNTHSGNLCSMNSGIRPTLQSELEDCLKNKEAKRRLCTYFEVLMKINDREKVVINEYTDNKRRISSSRIRDEETCNIIQ